MVENVYNSQSIFGIAEQNSSTRQSEQKILGSQEESNSEDYKLSLSKEGWKILENDSSGEKLNEEDQRKVEELKKIDRKVHIHEQAHLSAAGGYASGGASYDYVSGPDGKRYANAGHVNIDVSPEKTPEATMRKADVVRRAALAPADPSPADRQIAANASKMAQEAQKELAAKRIEAQETKSASKSTSIETPDMPDVSVSVSEST